jgi:hypothetical protein
MRSIGCVIGRLLEDAGLLGVLALLAMAICHPCVAATNGYLPVFIHFFDWFGEESWREDQFVDPFDWKEVGTSLKDRGTTEFYSKQFAYIASLGIDNIAWEYNAKRGGGLSLPPPVALQALGSNHLKIAPVYDLEITLRVYQGATKLTPEIATPGSIAPTAKTSDMICRDLAAFYERVPAASVARDKQGNAVVFVFGFGFNDENPAPSMWEYFARHLESCVASFLGARFKFYWSASNHRFEEHLFLKDRQHFTPWQFVSDTPQSQFSHDSVTWNFGFDNLAVLRTYHLQRVIRMDPRYLEEAAWLAAATDPSVLFIYGWNEPFESSFLFPSRSWGNAKAKLAQYYIDRLRRGERGILPTTLIIVDDLDELYTRRIGDWHLELLREMLLYRMRLMAPQADVVVEDEVTPELLSHYEGAIDLTSEKTERLVEMLRQHLGRLRLMLFDPLAPRRTATYKDSFFATVDDRVVNREIPIEGLSASLFARDDVHVGDVCTRCAVKLWADLEGRRLPLVITLSHAVFVNSYANDPNVMRVAFEEFYGRALRKSILYGEGLASQRLEVSPDGKYTLNRLLRDSVDGRWPIPQWVGWNRMPPEVGPEYSRFLFGQE